MFTHTRLNRVWWNFYFALIGLVVISTLGMRNASPPCSPAYEQWSRRFAHKSGRICQRKSWESGIVWISGTSVPCHLTAPTHQNVVCTCDGETPHIRQKRIMGLPLFLFIDIWWLRYIHAPTHSIVCCSTVVGHSMSLCSVSGWRQPVIQGQPKGKPTNLLESSLRYYSIHYRHSKLQVCLTNASRSKCSVLSYCTE